MRKLTLTVALTGLALAAGAAEAQPSNRGRAATMEGPRAPCRAVAMRFDERLSRMIGGVVAAADDQVSRATTMRNQGMEACQAGRVEEGRRMIEEATGSLRS